MGFFKDLAKGVTDYVVNDVYESHRHEVPVEVQHVTDRALVLIREKSLTPKKMAKLAAYDVDLLRWIGRPRGALLPGLPAEQKKMNELARAALALTVEREVGGGESASSKPPPQSSEWKKFRGRLADQIWSMSFGQALIIDVVQSTDRYVQFLHLPTTKGEPVLMGEVGGPLSDGEGSGLTMKQLVDVESLGWAPPPDGFTRETPNFRLVWDSAGELEPSDSFLSRADAEHAAKLAIKTLRGPFGAKSPGDLRTRKVDDAYDPD